MELLQQFQQVKGYLEKTETICNMDVLFIEPSVTKSIEARKNNVKMAGSGAESGIDFEKSDMDKYNRYLVMATAHDPKTRTPIFKTVEAFESVFAEGGTCGEVVLNEFLAGAQCVLKKEVKHNRRKGDKKDEATEGNS